MARDVIASGSDDPGALRCAAHALSHFAQDFPAALATLNRALRLQPSSAQVLSSLGWVHCHAGDPEPAIEYFGRSLRLSPLDLEIGVTLSGLGIAYLMTGRTPEAHAPLRRAVEERPKWATGYRNLILACVRLGRLDEARAAGSRMLENIPNTRAGYTSPMSNQDFVTEQREAMRLAGIPE